MNLTYGETEKTLEIKHNDSDLQVSEIPECFHENVDSNRILPSSITITIDDFRLGTVLKV